MKSTADGSATARRPGSRRTALPLLGWRERVSLPDLGLRNLKAKVDTGARTSSLHVSSVTTFRGPDRATWLRLMIPVRRAGRVRLRRVEIRSAGLRRVKSSTGHGELRHSFRARLTIGKSTWKIEITLSDRSEMRFPMLIGRTAIRGRYLVHSGRSYLQSKGGT
jgi:hypothetical protein